MKEDRFISVTVNEGGFEYDIHSLVKAFYPECEVKVTIGEEAQPQCASFQASDSSGVH